MADCSSKGSTLTRRSIILINDCKAQSRDEVISNYCDGILRGVH